MIFRKKALFNSIASTSCATFYVEMQTKSYTKVASTKVAPTGLPTPSVMSALTVTVPVPTQAIVAALIDSPELLNEIAALVAARLEPTAKTSQQSDWLTVEEAAEYLRCKKRRIYDLTSQERLTAVKDGSRNLYARTELDRHLAVDDYARAVRRSVRYDERIGALAPAQGLSFGRHAGVAA